MRYLLLLLLCFGPNVSWAMDAHEEVGFILNSFLLLFSGCLVMLMAAGFAMLEAGMVRTKSVAVILIKNMSILTIACLMFYLMGFNLMHLDVKGGFFGTPSPFTLSDFSATLHGSTPPFSITAFWFFQLLFAASAASIISGALAERIKIWAFFLFALVYCGVIYPIAGSWIWGDGWLARLGFLDFAGGTIVHTIGGVASLTGAIILGPRRGRFKKDGTIASINGHSLPLTTLGTFILWFGWFGFNSGSYLFLDSPFHVINIAHIIANTMSAASGGLIIVMIASQILYRRLDLPLILNGVLAGLVSITAEPLTPTIGQAFLIGGLGGLIMMAATRLLERLTIDDVVGAVPVHLACGIWGTLAVTITNMQANFTIQSIGLLAVICFTGITTYLLWTLLKYTIGIRLHWSHEEQGSDITHVGLKAYNIESNHIVSI